MHAARRAASLTSAMCSACAALLLSSAVWGQDAAPAAEAAEEAHPLAQLDWKIGPTKVPAGSNATLEIPAGYVFLDAPNTDKFMEITQNTSDGRSYTFAPEDLRWFALLQFEESGYVKDDEEIDADALLASVREGTERGNAERRERGWPEMHVTGWRFKPRYDKDTHFLEWAIDAQSAGEAVTNFNTRILGRRGVTSVVLVDDPSRLETSIPEFKAVLAGYSFNEGERYSEFKPGDKVATYGLAALVAGGAAAAAAKSGLLKGLWKFLLVGGAALLAGLRALFKRKGSSPAA